MNNIEFGQDTSAQGIAGFLAEHLGKLDGACIAVPGGNTPGPIFAELAARDLDWGKIGIWLTDDRCVPENHRARNLGLLRKHLSGTEADIIPLSQDLDPPKFDLVWIGMGADGHIASLFPNMNPRAGGKPEVIRNTPDPLPPEAPFDRLSLNMAAITNTDILMLVISGSEKKAVLDDAIMGQSDLPIARLLKSAEMPIKIFWSPS